MFINNTIHVVRYIDESGNRQVFKAQNPEGQKWHHESDKYDIITK